MKKTILTLSLLVASLLSAEESTYTQFMNTAIEDVYDIHNYSKENMQDMLQSDIALQNYTQKVETYEEKVSQFIEKQTQTTFNSQEDASKALDELDKLSIENVKLAKTLAYLASHQADNSNESYNNTIETTSKTILRLSDDIGVMADRILLMAKEIGIMADRILETQEIQSANLIATQKLTQYAMQMTNSQINTTRVGIQKNVDTAMTNNNMNNIQASHNSGTPQTMPSVQQTATPMQQQPQTVTATPTSTTTVSAMPTQTMPQQGTIQMH